MANANKFVPEVWAQEILLANRQNLVAGQSGVVNHDYEGDIASAGDTVHINGLEPVTVKTYDRVNGLGAPQRLTTNRVTLSITEEKAYDFLVDDIEKAQTNPKYMATATSEASYVLSLVQDEFVLGTMLAGADAGNAVSASIVAPEDFYSKVLVPLRTKLNKAKVRADGRFVIIDPEAEAFLLLDKRFTASGADAADSRLLNGEVGRAAGFSILVSTSTQVAGSPAVGTTPAVPAKCIAGIANATTVADQVVKTRGMESENYFGTRVNGLHVYGAKVVRPKNLAVASWTV